MSRPLDGRWTRLVVVDTIRARRYTVADTDHCWDAILDSGGVIPICIPLDPKVPPFRMIQVTREEQMFIHYKCCCCSARATRRIAVEREAGHGPHHDVFCFPEKETLPDGPCSGVATP